MKNKLKRYRKEIDCCDKELIKILSLRFRVGKKIGEYKKKYSLKPKDKEREKEMLKIRKKWGKRGSMDSMFIENFFNLILKETRKNHKKIINPKDEK